HLPEDEFLNHFTVMVQFGAIIAVVVEYFRLLTRQWRLYPVLFAAFLPAAVIGLALHKLIERALENAWGVSITLFVGGVVLLFMDRIFKQEWIRNRDVNEINLRQAGTIGVFQCLALIPGMSRSAATIWGGLFVGTDQRTATEFSFLLGLLTLSAATFYK